MQFLRYFLYDSVSKERTLQNRNNSYKRYLSFFFSCDPQWQTYLLTYPPVAPVPSNFTFVSREAFTLLSVTTDTNCNKAVKK